MVCRGQKRNEWGVPKCLCSHTPIAIKVRKPEFPVQGVHGSFPLDPEYGAAFGCQFGSSRRRSAIRVVWTRGGAWLYQVSVCMRTV